MTVNQPNETVEKPLVRKMFIKISHNRLKNCQNVAKMLCGTPKTRHFSAFLSHFSKIIFEKRLIRQFQRQRLNNRLVDIDTHFMVETTEPKSEEKSGRKMVEWSMIKGQMSVYFLPFIDRPASLGRRLGESPRYRSQESSIIIPWQKSITHSRASNSIARAQSPGGSFVRACWNGSTRCCRQPVALISAPAGFGKTTLLSQWLDRCPLPNAWLQLDEDDHEIPAFLAGVVAALRQLFPDCLRKTADLLLTSGTIPLAIWKSTLIDDLALLEDTPCVLALDDYHLVGNPSIDLLLADVLRSESLSIHLIISARRSPSLSFSKLRVQRRIVEIPTAAFALYRYGSGNVFRPGCSCSFEPVQPFSSSR